MTTSTRIKSLPSSNGAFFVDVKEVKSIKSTYVYQHFKQDEKDLNESLINVYISPDGISRNVGSYIEINIEPPSFVREVPSVAMDAIELSNRMIFTENDFGGNLFTGIKASIPDEVSELREIIKESTSILINPATSSINVSSSTTDFIRKFANTANSDNFLFSETAKKNIDKFFQNASSEAINDIEANNDLSFLGYSFSGNYNSLILKDIEKTITENSTCIFARSINNIRSKLIEIQDNAVSQANDTVTLSNYYPLLESNQIILENVDTLFPNSATFDPVFTSFEDIGKVGYRVKARFLLSNGKVVNIAPFIFKSPNATTFYLTNPPYGSQATILVEPIYAIKIPVINESLYKQFSRGVIFVTGTGKSSTLRLIDKVPPPPPQDLNFNLTKKGLEINWSLPFNKQRDISKFKIYKRRNKKEPFVLIHQIDFSIENDDVLDPVPGFLNERLPPGNVKTFYTDTHFNKESGYVYAVSTVDAHGLLSDYSEQIFVKVNPVFNRLETKLFARIGAPLSYPNITIEEEIFTDVIKASGYNKMKVFFNPDFLRVFQKDTNNQDVDLLNINPDQQKTFKINLINVDLQQKQNLDIIISEGIRSIQFENEDTAVVRSFLEEIPED